MFDAIVEAAAQVLVQEGPKATTNRIAERAGVSVGSLYQYFGNKQAVFNAVGERHVARLMAMHDTMADQFAHLPLEVAIPAAVHGMLAIERADPDLGGVLHRLNSEVVTDRILAFEDHMANTIAGFLHERVAAGELHIPDPDLRATILIRALGGIVRRTLATNPHLVTEARFTDEMTALVAGYLKP